MDKIANNVLELIGNTPLIRLNHLIDSTKHPNINIFAKLEFNNPGGSVKDRTALFMIRDAEKAGKLQQGYTIIEPTAGNTGIGLAVVASQLGYKVIFTVPERFSIEKQQLMKALGAQIINTPTEIGMEGAIEKAQQIHRLMPESFIPQQFSNPSNARAHYETTGREIFEQLDGKIDYFIAGVGTGGTFSGAAKFLKERLPNVKTYVVEPQGSIIAGKPAGRHKIEGIGVDNLATSKNLALELIDEVFTIGDKDVHEMIKLLGSKEGLLVGSSSAAAAVAAKMVAERIIESNGINNNNSENKNNNAKNKDNNPKTINIVTIFPDRVDRYLSKNILGEFEEWKY
ncbi:TPA: cysteine synthase family protein [Candidatus Woesearchaeota archaeon]|nr:cysteine synthase family protein [Candidatus Woesearchaeota archaeon]